MEPTSALPNRYSPATNGSRLSAALGRRIFFWAFSYRWATKSTPYFFLVFLCGCHPVEPSTDETQAIRGAPSHSIENVENKLAPPLAARRALERNDTAGAKRHIREALLAKPDDVESLKLAAEIAQAENDVMGAVELMIEVLRIQDFADEVLLQQCARGLLSSGKLFETIDLLQEALEKQPTQTETRRNLFYFLINTEQHRRAQRHGQILVRERAFDKSVLFWMATYQQRDVPPDSMNALFKLNPEDRRLEIAKLRVLFDNGQWERFAEVTDSLLSDSPDFVPAQLLFGQHFVRTDKFDQISEWAQGLSPDIKLHWQYWDVLGDWAVHRQKFDEAARAYYEAARRDPTIASVATKLARSLRLCDPTSIPSDAIEVAGKRGELLSRFLQEKERYHKRDRRSNAAIAEMATTLEQLGRVWEAEAWISVGVAEPDEDLGRLQKIHQRVAAKLEESPPWQVKKGQPFFSLDLGFLPLPRIEQLEEPNRSTTTSEFVHSADPRLTDVSNQRGLVDHPCDPVTVGNGVIPLYAQLGFGGAAIDFDSDGWTDIYLASCGTEPLSNEAGDGRLFRNIGGEFVQAGDLAGIHDRGFAQGVAAGDINEDGFTDLVLLNYGYDQVFINNGDGTFAEKSNWIKDSESNWSTSGAIADVDLDGISDFICLKYCTSNAPDSEKMHDAPNEFDRLLYTDAF